MYTISISQVRLVFLKVHIVFCLAVWMDVGTGALYFEMNVPDS